MSSKQQRIEAYLTWLGEENLEAVEKAVEKAVIEKVLYGSVYQRSFNSMIIPSIGRKVWFWRSPPRPSANDQPEDATICYVHHDTMVNLLVTSHKGETRAEEMVLLVPSNQLEQHPVQGAYATWMPSQIGQGAKEAASQGQDQGQAKVTIAYIDKTLEFHGKQPPSSPLLPPPPSPLVK